MHIHHDCSKAKNVLSLKRIFFFDITRVIIDKSVILLVARNINTLSGSLNFISNSHGSFRMRALISRSLTSSFAVGALFTNRRKISAKSEFIPEGLEHKYNSNWDYLPETKG